MAERTDGMNISYFEMSEKDKELAVHLAPQEELDKLSLAKHGAILAVDNEKQCAVGIMIYSYARAERLDIEWLYVYETYRCQEIGGELLIAAYDLAMNAGLPYVGARLTGELATDENADVADNYLQPRGFRAGMYVEGDWIIKKEELSGLASVGDKYRSANVFPVSRISSTMLKAFLRDHWNTLKQSPLYTHESALTDMDTELSVAYMTPEGEIDAILLVQKVGDVIYPLTFYMCHPRDAVFLAMAVAVIDEIRKIPGDVVSHIVYSKRAAELLVKIFKNHTAVPTYQLLADADWYERDKEMMEKYDYFYPDPTHVAAPTAYNYVGCETYGDQRY